LAREHAPLEYGLRITTLVRDTTEQAWRDAEAKIADIAGKPDLHGRNQGPAVGQQRLLDQVPPANVSPRDRRTLDVLARELWRRDADPVRALGGQAPGATLRHPARAL